MNQEQADKIAEWDEEDVKEEQEEKLKTEFRNGELDDDGEFEDGSCQTCGEPLNNAEGTYCPECLASRSEE
jgi:predicted amidophosphoribosyltransferase